MRELISEYGTAIVTALVGVTIIGILWYVVDNLELLNTINIKALI